MERITYPVKSFKSLQTLVTSLPLDGPDQLSVLRIETLAHIPHHLIQQDCYHGRFNRIPLHFPQEKLQASTHALSKGNMFNWTFDGEITKEHLAIDS